MSEEYEEFIDIMHQFKRPLTLEDEMNIKIIKGLGNNLYTILSKLGACREISLAKTKLEEAIMWTVKGISS